MRYFGSGPSPAAVPDFSPEKRFGSGGSPEETLEKAGFYLCHDEVRNRMCLSIVFVNQKIDRVARRNGPSDYSITSDLTGYICPR